MASARAEHAVLAIMAAYVGLDPHKDINWVDQHVRRPSPMELFVDGKIDAFLGFPPEPQELRARKIGHVILNTPRTSPGRSTSAAWWSATGSSSASHPVATKRVAAGHPQGSRPLRRRAGAGRAAAGRWRLHASATTTRSQTLTELPYALWREFDPEDTLRFYALRLHEVGMIKSSPNELIAEGTDWRFLNELKRELKA